MNGVGAELDLIARTHNQVDVPTAQYHYQYKQSMLRSETRPDPSRKETLLGRGAPLAVARRRRPVRRRGKPSPPQLSTRTP